MSLEPHTCSFSHVFKLYQPPQEEQKEAGIKEEPKEEADIQPDDGEKNEEEPAEMEKEDKGEERVQEEGKKEKTVKDKKPEEAKGSKRQKTIQCKVIMLDDSQFDCELDVRQVLDDMCHVLVLVSSEQTCHSFSTSVLNAETC